MSLCLLDSVVVIEKQAGWQNFGPDFLHLDIHALAFVYHTKKLDVL
jgi:hypothetical protein